MSNWGFESPEEWLTLLKLYNNLHILVKNENDPWCLLSQFSQLLNGQMSKLRSVLKSSEWADFKTDLPFWMFLLKIPSIFWDMQSIWGRKHFKKRLVVMANLSDTSSSFHPTVTFTGQFWTNFYVNTQLFYTN